MSRRRFYYDADLDAVLEYGANYFEDTARGPNVISDDIGAGVNGLRHMPSGMHSDSKSVHRRETRARGLVEIGNDRIDRQPREKHDFVREVIDAKQQIASNYNGTADRLRREREQRR